MRTMAERRVFLVVLWLVAMASVDLSMGKIFPSFKSLIKDEVRKVDKSKPASPQTDNTINTNAQAQKGGNEVNTAPSDYVVFNTTHGKVPNADSFEVNTAPSKQGCAKNGACHLNSQKEGDMTNTAPKQGGAKDHSLKHHKEDNMPNTVHKLGGANHDEAGQYRGADYAVEKREQARKLREIIASQGKERARDKAYAAYAFASDKAGGAINQASYMAGKFMDNAPDMARATKRKAEEMADYAMNKASDMTIDATNMAFNMASSARSKAPNMASDAMHKGSHISWYPKDAVKYKMHAASEYAERKAKGGMNTPNMADIMNKGSHMGCALKDPVNQKMHSTSEYAKREADRAMNTASNMGWDTMNKVKDQSYTPYGHFTAEKVGEAMDKTSNAYQYASDKVDEKIRMATEKGREAKVRWEDVKAHGKDKAFESYIDAKARALEAYQLAKDTMLEIIARENNEVVREKVYDASGNSRAYVKEGVVGNGVRNGVRYGVRDGVRNGVRDGVQGGVWEL